MSGLIPYQLQMQLKNLRASIELDERHLVLYGTNGAGKTAFINALELANGSELSDLGFRDEASSVEFLRMLIPRGFDTMYAKFTFSADPENPDRVFTNRREISMTGRDSKPVIQKEVRFLTSHIYSGSKGNFLTVASWILAAPPVRASNFAKHGALDLMLKIDQMKSALKDIRASIKLKESIKDLLLDSPEYGDAYKKANAELAVLQQDESRYAAALTEKSKELKFMFSENRTWIDALNEYNKFSYRIDAHLLSDTILFGLQRPSGETIVSTSGAYTMILSAALATAFNSSTIPSIFVLPDRSVSKATFSEIMDALKTAPYWCIAQSAADNIPSSVPADSWRVISFDNAAFTPACIVAG